MAQALVVLVGLWLTIAPWVLGYERAATRWDDVACGISIVLLALPRAGIRPRMIANLLLAAWLLVAAFTIDARVNEIVDDVIAGSTLALLSLWGAAAAASTGARRAPARGTRGRR